MVFHLCLQQTKKVVETHKCTSVAGHFDGHADALKQYTQHCPLEKIQDHTRCPWMPPLVAYLLCIAPAAARVTGKHRTIKNTPTFLAMLMAMAMRRYVTTHIAQWRRSRASLEATGCHHWASIMSDNIKGTYLHWFLLMIFIVHTLKTGTK